MIAARNLEQILQMSPISVCGFDLTVSKAQSCLGEFHPHSRSGQGRKGMKRSNVCAAACPLLKAFLEVLPMIYAWLSLTQLRHIFVKEAKKYSYLVDPLVPQTKVGFTWREKRGINNGKAVSSMLWMHCFIAYCFCVQTPQDIVLKRWKKKPVYTSSLFRQCCCPKSPSSNRRPHHSRIPLQNWTAVPFPFPHPAPQIPNKGYGRARHCRAWRYKAGSEEEGKESLLCTGSTAGMSHIHLTEAWLSLLRQVALPTYKGENQLTLITQ